MSNVWRCGCAILVRFSLVKIRVTWHTKSHPIFDTKDLPATKSGTKWSHQDDHCTWCNSQASRFCIHLPPGKRLNDLFLAAYEMSTNAPKNACLVLASDVNTPPTELPILLNIWKPHDMWSFFLNIADMFLDITCPWAILSDLIC